MRTILNFQQRNSLRINLNEVSNLIIQNQDDKEEELQFNTVYYNESLRIINEKEMFFLFPSILKSRNGLIIAFNCQNSNITNRSPNFESNTQYFLDMLKMLMSELEAKGMYMKVSLLKLYNEKYYDLLLNLPNTSIEIDKIHVKVENGLIQFCNTINKELNGLQDIHEVERRVYANNGIYNRDLQIACDSSNYIYNINLYKNENNIIHQYVLSYLVLNYDSEDLNKGEQKSTIYSVNQYASSFYNYIESLQKNSTVENSSSNNPSDLLCSFLSLLLTQSCPSILSIFFLTDTSISLPSSQTILYFYTLNSLLTSVIQTKTTYKNDGSILFAKPFPLSDSYFLSSFPNSNENDTYNRYNFGNLNSKVLLRDQDLYEVPPPSPHCLSPVDSLPIASSSDNEAGILSSSNSSPSWFNSSMVRSSSYPNSIYTPLNNSKNIYPVFKRSILNSKKRSSPSPFHYNYSASRSSSLDSSSSIVKDNQNSLLSFFKSLHHEIKTESTGNTSYKKQLLSEESLASIQQIEQKMKYLNGNKLSTLQCPNDLHQAKYYVERGIQCEKNQNYKMALNAFYKAQVLIPDDYYLIEYIYNLKKKMNSL